MMKNDANHWAIKKIQTQLSKNNFKMKKKIILLAALAISSLAYSQVGINNETPKATLDITAKTTDGTKPEGIIAPRLTGDQIKLGDAQYDTPQTGAIVYATAAITTTPTVTDKTKNITAIGYYYFDGAFWQALKGSATEPWNVSGSTTPAILNSQNIYQMGRVAIGTDPGATPTAVLSINEINSDPSTGVTGIRNNLTLNNGASPTNSNSIYSRVTDSRQDAGVPLLANQFLTIINGTRTSTTGTGAGDYHETYLRPATGTYAGNQYFGKYNYIGFNPAAGGNVNMVLATAASANFNYILPAGNFTSTGVHGSASGFDRLHIEPTASGTATISTSFGHRSWTEHISSGNITVNNIKTIESRTSLIKGAGNLNITGNVYGLDIYKDPLSAGSANIDGNIYGIHIDPFMFNGHPAERTYNLYSEGATTKNYFQGRVGIGQNAPTAQLHIVKQAADLTPTIIEGCGEYAGNTGASAAGLPVGALYRTASGVLMVRY